MSSPATPAKICIHCGEDCSKKARSKDPQGRYACKECHEQAIVAARATPAAVTAGGDPEFDVIAIDDDAAMMAGLADQVAPVQAGDNCPSCGAAVGTGAVICTTCGYNLQTGGQLKVKKRSARAGAAMDVASSVAMAPVVLGLAAVGGAVGGAIGAVIWAVVSYSLNLEIGFAAWGVGALVGIGAYAGANKRAGVMTGLIAAAIALISVGAGKYAAVSLMVDDLVEKSGGMITYSDDELKVTIANTLAAEQEAEGKTLAWPSGYDYDNAEEPAHFPKSIWTDVEKRWTSMSGEERESFRREQEEGLRAMIAANKERIKEVGFEESFSLFDILWGLLAIGTAFSIGSGMSGSDE